MTIPDRIRQLVREHGTLAAVAKHLQLNESHLCRLRSSTIYKPQKHVLDKLGLKMDYVLVKSTEGDS